MRWQQSAVTAAHQAAAAAPRQHQCSHRIEVTAEHHHSTSNSCSCSQQHQYSVGVIARSLRQLSSALVLGCRGGVSLSGFLGPVWGVDSVVSQPEGVESVTAPACFCMPHGVSQHRLYIFVKAIPVKLPPCHAGHAGMLWSAAGTPCTQCELAVCFGMCCWCCTGLLVYCSALLQTQHQSC